MTEQEATFTLAILNAAFPREALEPPTVKLWLLELLELQSGAAAEKAARQCARGGDRFPSIKEFRLCYRQASESLNAGSSPELEEVTSGSRTIPDEVKTWMSEQGMKNVLKDVP